MDINLTGRLQPMFTLNRSQLALLAGVTLSWGLNWPVMKLGVTGSPPLAFRALSIWLGLPLAGLILVHFKVPLRVSRPHWREMLVLAATNMVVPHTCMILAVSYLSSGRAAILNYTMPIFAALMGVALFGATLTRRAWLGVGAAALGVILLLWYEMTKLAGSPVGVVLALAAACAWALGTHLLRRTTIQAPTLAISFCMTAGTAVVVTVLSALIEMPRWQAPSHDTWFAIGYNAVLVFGVSQAAWFTLARNLPPVASTLSVMLIPVLGLFGGAIWLHEELRWQDWAAVGLMMMAIASVLLPSRR